MKKALLIGVDNPAKLYELQRIGDELSKLGWDHQLVYYEDFQVSILEGRILFDQRGVEFRLSDYGFGYMRSSVNDTHNYHDLKQLLVMELQNSHIFNCNGRAFIQHPHFPKILQHYCMQKTGIPSVSSYYQSQFKENVLHVDFPMIVKKSQSSMGRDVFFVRSVEEYTGLLRTYQSSELLYQPYLPGGRDVRVFVVGGIALGAIERLAPPGSHLSNISAGGKANAIVMSSEVRALAEKAARNFDLDVCGVDIIFEKGVARVLEVNRHAQFQGFEKATGINVARKIVEFMVEKAR